MLALPAAATMVTTHLAAASWPMSLLSWMFAPLLPSAAAAAALPWLCSLAPESKLLSCFILLLPTPHTDAVPHMQLVGAAYGQQKHCYGTENLPKVFVCYCQHKEQTTIHPSTTILFPQFILTSGSLPDRWSPAKYKHQQQQNSSSKKLQPAHTEAQQRSSHNGEVHGRKHCRPGQAAEGHECQAAAHRGKALLSAQRTCSAAKTLLDGGVHPSTSLT